MIAISFCFSVLISTGLSKWQTVSGREIYCTNCSIAINFPFPINQKSSSSEFLFNFLYLQVLTIKRNWQELEDHDQNDRSFNKICIFDSLELFLFSFFWKAQIYNWLGFDWVFDLFMIVGLCGISREKRRMNEFLSRLR